MRFATSIIVIALLASIVPSSFAIVDSGLGEAAKQLPDKIGSFTAKGSASIPARGFSEEGLSEDNVVSHAARTYSAENGETVTVYLSKTRTDSGAYALLTRSRSFNQRIRPGVIGIAGIVGPRWVFFAKGNTFVKLQTDADGSYEESLVSLATDLARELDAGENDLPVLVKHLPDWQNVQTGAHYAVSKDGLKGIISNQPILDEINFEGGAEAAVANYGDAQLVIVEFTTPQLAGDNDRRITAKLDELRGPGQPVGTRLPSAYRRVGNYSVFVFDAPDEKTATQLIDQVKYEQVVQWLGENPYWFEKVQRIYAQTTAGVLLTVIQSSGLSLLICLGIGGIFGVFLFRRRRAQQAGPAYSDAGGMVRLNIDEMTADGDRSKLLSDGKS
ncbi:MAG: hypothetical protein QOE77_1269 [Blastocatellia bacterium]|nr:hypothetical protein [Blastocatellia bacterium]